MKTTEISYNGVDKFLHMKGIKKKTNKVMRLYCEHIGKHQNTHRNNQASQIQYQFPKFRKWVKENRTQLIEL